MGTVNKHMFVIMGPAGCGKSTVAQYLARELDVPMIEGDDYHTEVNRTKMQKGVALTDTDRWDWLISLREKAVETLLRDDTGDGIKAVFIACSALKKKYRDVLRIAALENKGIKVTFVYPKVEEDALIRRLEMRKGHYMKKEMLRSQLEALEPPMQEGDAVTVDGSRKVEYIVEELVALLEM